MLALMPANRLEQLPSVADTHTCQIMPFIGYEVHIQGCHEHEPHCKFAALLPAPVIDSYTLTPKAAACLEGSCLA